MKSVSMDQSSFMVAAYTRLLLVEARHWWVSLITHSQQQLFCTLSLNAVRWVQVWSWLFQTTGPIWGTKFKGNDAECVESALCIVEEKTCKYSIYVSCKVAAVLILQSSQTMPAAHWNGCSLHTQTEPQSIQLYRKWEHNFQENSASSAKGLWVAMVVLTQQSNS